MLDVEAAIEVELENKKHNARDRQVQWHQHRSIRLCLLDYEVEIPCAVVVKKRLGIIIGQLNGRIWKRLFDTLLQKL